MSVADVGPEPWNHCVTRALVDTEVPVPYPVLLCTDENVLGLPFAVTRFVPGSSVPSRADLDALDILALSAIVGALIESLAALHTVDYQGVGLGDFGPSAGYAERQIRRWTRQWTHVGVADLNPLAQELADCLAAVEFVQESAGVVHGDYRIDNTLIDLGAGGSGAGVNAIVDWELSTIGHPTADVAMMCVYRHPALDLVLGAPSAWTSPRLPDSDAGRSYERPAVKRCDSGMLTWLSVTSSWLSLPPASITATAPEKATGRGSPPLLPPYRTCCTQGWNGSGRPRADANTFPCGSTTRTCWAPIEFMIRCGVAPRICPTKLPVVITEYPHVGSPSSPMSAPATGRGTV